MTEPIDSVAPADGDLGFFEVEVKGRLLTFNNPTEGQKAVILRASTLMERSGMQTKSKAVVSLLDVFMAMAASDEDFEFLDRGLINGTIDLSADFKAIIETWAEDGGDSKPAKAKARSGRR